MNTMDTSESMFLQAFEGRNTKVPVWFMRQAGRYLPHYQVLRKRHDLNEMFDNPELAAEVTCMPIDLLGVDAAILFADILTLPRYIGFEVTFVKKQGPLIQNPLSKSGDLSNLDDIPNLRTTIQLVLKRLPHHIPLIGFAGSPFTVLCYLLEGGASLHFNKVFSLAYRQPDEYHKIMEHLTRNTIHYLSLQKEAGIHAFQLFDTWAGILRPVEYERWVLPYIKRIFQSVELPSIYYLKNSLPLLELMEKSGADFLSVCASVDFRSNPFIKNMRQGIQGNLFNGLLYADYDILKREIATVLEGAKNFQRYIFNLSHGIYPDTDVDKVKFIVDQVHQWKRDE